MYIDTMVGQEAIRCRFRWQTGSAGLFEDNEKWCVLCGSGEVDVEHFLVRCMNSSGRGRGCWKGIEGAAAGDYR